jgi:hypothetical protein
MKHVESAGGRSPLLWVGLALVIVATAILATPLPLTRVDLIVIGAVGLVIGAAGFALSRFVARQRRMTGVDAELEPPPAIPRLQSRDLALGAEPIVRANSRPNREDVPRRGPRPARGERPAVGTRRRAPRPREPGRSRRDPLD